MKTMKKILVWVLCIAMLIPFCTVFASAEVAVASDVANKALAYRRTSSTVAHTDVTLTSGLPSYTNKATFSIRVDQASVNGIVVDFNDGDVSRLVFTTSSEAGKIKLYRDGTSDDKYVMDINASTWYNITVEWTRGASAAKLYLDGVLVSDALNSGSWGSQVKFRIISMNNRDSGGIAFIDNLKFYGDNSATPFYANDFENETVGKIASGWGDYAGRVSVLVEETTDAPKALNKSLVYRKPTTTVAHTDVVLTSGLPTNTHKATFAIKLDEASPNGFVFDFLSGSKEKTRLIFARSQESGKISMYHSGTSSDKLVADLDASTWYSIALVWAQDSSVAKLYIDGELACDAVTASATATYVDKIQILSMNNRDSGGIAFIDDIKLYGDNNETPYYVNDFNSEITGKIASGWGDYAGKVSVLVEETMDYPPAEAELPAPPNRAIAYRRPNNGSIAHTDVTLTSGLPSYTSKATFSVKVDQAPASGIVVDFNDGDVSRLVFTSSSEAGKIKLYRDGTSADQYVMDLNVSTWYNIAIEWTSGASKAKLYVDGILVSDALNSGSWGSQVKFRIVSMNNREAGGIAFIDNLKIYGVNSATPFYANDFENETVGKIVSGWGDYSGRVSVLVEETADAPVDLNKAIVYRKPSTTVAHTSVTLSNGLPTNTAKASFSIKLDEASPNGFVFDFISGSKEKARLVFARSQQSGKISMYHSGTSSDKLVADLDASKWYNIALVWTNDSNVASLYVDGELVCDTVTTTTAATCVDKVQILSMNNRDSGGIAYIDNLKLYGNNSDEPYYANDFEAETIGKVVNGWDDYSGRVSVLVEETINAPKPEKISVADAIVEDFEEKTTADLIEPWWVGVDQSSSSNGGAITSIDGTNAYKVYQNGSGMTKTYRVFKPTEKLTVSFDYLISEAAVKSGSYISLSPKEGNWAYSICINKVNESDTLPMLRYGPNYTNFKQIECGKWYNFKFEYDNGTVKFYIDDEFAFTIPTDKTDITSIDRIFFATSSNNSSVVTYYVDNLTLIGAEDFRMNDKPTEFTDTFDKTPTGYTFSGDGSYSVNNGKLTLVGDISAKREVVDTQSGLFGFDFEADKLEGITVTLYQDNIEAVVVKFEEDGTLVGKILGSEWAEISDPGKLKAGEQYSFALDLPFDRLTNNFDVLINGILEATAPRTVQFNYINSIKISVPAGSTVSMDSLYVLESNGIIEAPEREESSPDVYVPTVIEGTKTMYLASDKSPLESTLSYASSSTKLTLDTMYMSIGVDLGSVQDVNAIRITGVSEMDRPVRNSYYKVYQSDDNINWVQVKGFSFNHFTENGVSVALFEVTGVEARYVKVRCQYEQAASTFEIASVRAEVRTARQWKMAGYAMYALDDTNPAYTAMTRELYDKAITIKKGDSVGINFGVNSHVEAIELVGSGLSGLDASAFELYTSNNNAKYTRVENVILSRDVRDGKEVYRLSFPDTVCGYLKIHAVADMNVQLADLYDGLCTYSSVEADSGISNVNIGVDRGGEGDFYTLPNGTLVMMYTGYPADGSHGDYADNVIKAVQSTDGGYTWSEAWITLKKEDGDLNVMCPSYHYMANGDLAILYIEKISEPSASNLDAPSVAHIYIRRSSDNGRTWGSPICITEKPVAYSSLSSAVNGLHLSNGRFIVALTVDLNLEGTATGRDRVLVYTVYSDDDGYTWKKSATAVTHPHAACEPVVAELENGNLLMTVRTRVTGKIFQSISTDSGNTWSELAEVPNMVTPSSTNAVLSIPSTGDILIVWNNEEISNVNGGNGNRDPLCYAVSTDNGLSYKNLRNIVDGHATWPCVRFYGRAVYMQHGNTVRITDVAELYYTRNGSVTTANLPTAATPNATYSNGWLTGVTANMKYSLDGGATWFFCGGTSVQIGDVVGTIMIKDIGTATIAPSGTQIIGTTDVNVADIGILPGEVSEESLNTFITMAKEGVYDFKFNSGVYVFPKTIVLPSNISIVGDVDTVFMLTESASGKAASASVISIGSGIDNVRISNLTLKGYNETAYCPTAVSRHIGIAVDSALRVNIDNVNFIGFADSGIKITNMGSSFWNDKSYDEKQAYFKGLQLSNCLFEKNYYGINLGSRAEYCEFSNVTAGYNNVGCVNSGGNNSFVNCFFNNNVTGFYLDCTGKSNPGHGGVTGCSFNHNTENAVVIEGNKIGFSFTGCQFFDGKIKQTDSCGTIFSACVLGGVQFEASGSAGSGILTGCFFQSDSSTILAGNNGVFTVTDCVDLYSAKTITVSSDFNDEPTMVLLAATKEGVKAYDEITTLDASEFGVVPGNVSAEALDALIDKANEGGYTFKFDGGTYLLPKTVVLPSDTMLMGNGSTVFRLADGVIGTSANKAVLSIGSGVDNVRISNIIFEGSNTTPYCPTAKSNYLGIYISGALRVSIDNVTARGFNNAGLKIESVGYNFDHNDLEGSQAYFRGVKVTDCRFEGNYYGICLGRRAEYCQFTNVYSCYNNVGCDNEGGNNSFVNCSFNNNNKGFWMPCSNMPNHGHGGASGCTFMGNNTTAIEISDNSNGFTFNACSINGNIIVKNALGTIFNACIIDGALDAQGTSGSGILLACRLAGDIASVTDGVFMVADCLIGASANLSVATLTTLDYTKSVGTTINVADIGITSGIVSESALDSLMTLAANGGYTFVFGGGVYKFTKTLALPSNTTIIGNATTVLTLTGSNVGKVPVVSVIGVDNVRISGLTVKGELTQNYVADQIYSKDGSVGIHISRSSRVNLDNVRVLNFQYAAVLVDNVGADCVETVQISDCRFENSYYGLCLAENANYCQIVGTAMGYCSVGGIDSGAYNVFANCAFNKNRYGFYVYHTNFANAGAGMAINCCFNHNDSQGSNRPSNYQGIQIDNCQSGYIFSGCQLFGNLKQTNSTGVVISSTIFGSSVTTISGTAESNVMNGCFFQTDKTAILAGNNGVYKVVDCIEIPG